jgi:GTP 3',8-cyclase
MQLIDNFNRRVNYVRLSVTDRCDLRCTYCMSEDMQFLPRSEVLSIEEFVRLGKAFVELGVTKLRITGGEPLIRRGIINLLQQLGQLKGLKELCLTTNGTHLASMASAIKDAGVNRINISLDSLNPERFKQLTRYGDLKQVLTGIKAAQTARFERIKLNCVALKNYNADEVPQLVKFAIDEGLDISFIEEMPLGNINEHERAFEFISSKELREQLSAFYSLAPIINADENAGPARYWQAAGYTTRIGFISPHSQNFCSSCNRVRVTAQGRLLLCLGQENSVDLRKILREEDDEILKQAIITAMQLKPEKHTFDLTEEPQILRFMNMTGG